MNLRLYLDQVFTPSDAILPLTGHPFPPSLHRGCHFTPRLGSFSKMNGEYLNEDGQKYAHHIWSVTPLLHFPWFRSSAGPATGLPYRGWAVKQFLDLPAPL
jgi:hypothetical protein